MVRVDLDRSELEASSGDRLLDLCDEGALPQLFACRSGSCGVCRVRVLEGGALLDPAEASETATLEALGMDADERLACQIVVRGKHGHVRLTAAKM